MQQLQTGPAEKLLHVRRGGLQTTKRPGVTARRRSRCLVSSNSWNVEKQSSFCPDCTTSSKSRRISPARASASPLKLPSVPSNSPWIAWTMLRNRLFFVSSNALCDGNAFYVQNTPLFDRM